MLTRNVFYSERPERVVVNRIGNTSTCRVDLPTNIEEVETPDGGTQYKADVYSINAGYTANLAERVEANYDAWLTVAQEVPIPEPTIQDVIDAVNDLTDLILGGD